MMECSCQKNRRGEGEGYTDGSNAALRAVKECGGGWGMDWNSDHNPRASPGFRLWQSCTNSHLRFWVEWVFALLLLIFPAAAVLLIPLSPSVLISIFIATWAFHCFANRLPVSGYVWILRKLLSVWNSTKSIHFQ